jgi:hypothetical protein
MSFDPVENPAHYNEGRQFEVIDVLEDWASRAPDPVLGGLLWQSCKYLGRLFDKADPLEDAKKARWYLSRLIGKLEAAEEAAEALEAAHGKSMTAIGPATIFDPCSVTIFDPYDDPLR